MPLAHVLGIPLEEGVGALLALGAIGFSGWRAAVASSRPMTRRRTEEPERGRVADSR